jgi:Tol biopolymer transport system component
MPDLREVFEMVKQQTEPDVDSWAEQERRIRSTARKQKIGAFALVAALAVAAVVFLARNPSDDGGGVVPADTAPETVAPDTTAPLEPGFAQFDIATGETTSTGIVGNSSAVDVSPDGTMITYVGTSAGAADTVHVANIDGSNVQAFERTNAAGEANAPRWSPDGTTIVYQGKPSTEQIGNLYVLDVATGRIDRITNFGPIEAGLWWMAPTFSSDGQTVLFNKPRRAAIETSDSGQHWDIWSVPVSGGEPTLVHEDAFGVDVSPTGDAIAYTEVVKSDYGFQTGDLYVARPDGSGARKIADGSEGISRWSPDGSEIAFETGVGIDIVDVETGEVRTTNAGGWPEWVDADTLMIEVGDA